MHRVGTLPPGALGEDPDEGHLLDPMLTYDVYTWVDGRRRLRSYVISMTELEP